MEITFIQYICRGFRFTIQFADKRKINIDKIPRFIKLVKQCYVKMYGDNKNFKDVNIDFDIEEELNNVVCSYPNIFYFDDDNNICIYDEVDYLTLSKIECYENMYWPYFTAAGRSSEVFKVLEIDEIIDIKKKIEKLGFELESDIEKEYMKYPDTDKLYKLLYKRLVFIINVGIRYERYVREYSNIPDDNFSTCSEDYYNESQYKKHNEPFPIDAESYEKSKFYESSYELNPIQHLIEETYNYAIFGLTPIYRDKYADNFIKLYMYNFFKKSDKLVEDSEEDSMYSIDDIDDVDFDVIKEIYGDNLYLASSDRVDEEFYFYLVYTKKLNDLIEKGNKKLTKVRNRLLYLLDDIKYSLFISERFDEYYNSIVNRKFDDDSFDYYSSAAKYFIEDVFEGKAPKTIEKLLFISTYYDLTNDKKIVKIFNKYKNNVNYSEYYNIVFGREKGKAKGLVRK